MKRLIQLHFRLDYMLVYIVLFTLLPSCSKAVTVSNDEQRISFLKGYGIYADRDRPSYSSIAIVPDSFNATWEIRGAFSKDMAGISISKYKKKQCSIYMYPLSKLPFEVKKDMLAEARAVILTFKDRVVCSYIDFISESRGNPPVSLSGVSVEKITGVKWDKWKSDIESDDDKKIVVWKYYECLRAGNYDEAYLYMFDRVNIKKDTFIEAAKSLAVPDMDFLSLEQSNKPSDDQCSFAAEVKSLSGKRNKTYIITFELKKDPSSREYGGWKIVSTSIK